MMKMARNEKSTSVDAVITVIDTISSKLELISQDYRGSDALKLELTLFHKLFLRTRCLRSNQSSFLYDLFEEVRHFHLILRAERRLEYVMVEEISRFRQTLAIFQRRFCESNDTCLLDLVLDALQTMDDDKDGLGELKLELKLISLTNQASPLRNIMAEVYDQATHFCYLPHRMIENPSINHELVELCSSFRASLLKCCKHHIPRLQSDSNCDWYFLQLKKFYGSLSATLWDIYFWGQSHPRVNHFIRPLIYTMTFLKCFLSLAALKPDENCTIEWFFTHCQVSAIEAASLGFMCWFYRDDQEEWHQLQSRSCELLEKVRPGSGNVQVTQNYRQTLLTSNLPRSLVFHWDAYDRLSTLDFVGYLHGYLSQLVTDTTCFAVSSDQIKGIAMKLIRLRETLLDYGGNRDALIEVSQVTIIILDLLTLKRKDKMPKELELRIFQLLSYGTSHNTWITQLLGNTCPRILAKRSLDFPLPCLIVNGVLVSSGVKRAEQIKCQLLSNSIGLDLIAVVTKDGPSARATNMAKMVCDDSDVVSHFKIRAQCHCTDQAPGYKHSRKTLLKRVLDYISFENSCDYSEMSEDCLAEVVKERLRGKRYLILLCGVFSQPWRDVISSFPNDANQSKILLTSSTISNPGYFSLEPVSYIRRGMVKMGC